MRHGNLFRDCTRLWNNPLTYGFGYRCDNTSNTNLCHDFILPNYFKQFLNISNNQPPQIIIEGLDIGEITSTITYKVNISNTQPKGSYSNNITFIAIPKF